MERNAVLIGVVLSILFVIAVPSKCEASVFGNATAFCVGTNYGTSDINTTSDAINASTTYNSAGLSSIYRTVPSISVIQGTRVDGSPYLESGIVFLSGHGGSNGIQFNYLGYGGSYYVKICKDDYNYGTEPTCIGICGYSLDNVALFVFAACETADGSDNICETVVNEGAHTSIGWYTTVGATSHSQWLNRFNNYLKAGYTVLSACQYADSYNYNDNTVKNHSMYGKYFLNPISFINSNSLLLQSNQNTRESETLAKDIDDISIVTVMKEYLKKKTGKDASCFSIEVSGKGNQYYDYSYCVQNIKTNYAYTFWYNEKEKSISVYDNTNGIDLESLTEEIECKINTYDEVLISEEVDVNEYLDSIDGTITTVDCYLYYDIRDKNLYRCISYVAVDKDGMTYADTIYDKLY